MWNLMLLVSAGNEPWMIGNYPCQRWHKLFCFCDLPDLCRHRKGLVSLLCWFSLKGKRRWKRSELYWFCLHCDVRLSSRCQRRMHIWHTMQNCPIRLLPSPKLKTTVKGKCEHEQNRRMLSAIQSWSLERQNNHMARQTICAKSRDQHFSYPSEFWCRHGTEP